MKHFLTTSLLLLLLVLLTGQATFAAQISIGIRIGPPPPPRVVRVVPVRPAAEFVWVESYWYPVGRHWRWHEGYWTRAPYAGARWLAPRYEGGVFYQGYWEGGGVRVEHDHHWDKHRERDFREHEKHDHDHDRH
jgi:hypothetical protein